MNSSLFIASPGAPLFGARHRPAPLTRESARMRPGERNGGNEARVQINRRTPTGTAARCRRRIHHGPHLEGAGWEYGKPSWNASESLHLMRAGFVATLAGRPR